MHLLEDLGSLSLRAQNLLRRTGRREGPDSDPALEPVRLHDRDGGRLSAPLPPELVAWREGFLRRYGGLRYTVRSSFTANGKRYEHARDCAFDLGDLAWADPDGGWFSDWCGEIVSAPIRFLVHTDGRVGGMDGWGVFLEMAPTIPAFIESHALTDMVASWEPLPAGELRGLPADALEDLADVPEASGPTCRWRLSEDYAVCQAQMVTSKGDRPWLTELYARPSPAPRAMPSG
ncbi:MAG: hypothetical protein HOW97_40105 [Catenulispora sp.]|nr:hypothetical protein [Catenulispora sp.]